jgi:hypothetical protein
MKFKVHFHNSPKSLIIECEASHALDARDEIAKIIGNRPKALKMLLD